MVIPLQRERQEWYLFKMLFDYAIVDTLALQCMECLGSDCGGTFSGAFIITLPPLPLAMVTMRLY